jgi:arylsulfatase A-like enzyme
VSPPSGSGGRRNGRARNLLWLWTDQQRADTIGAYRAPQTEGPRTPHLDRLAGAAAVFEQAYCAMPICTPARATALTGVFPHTHRTTRNHAVLTRDYPTLAERLTPRGYVCGYAGKWHLGHELSRQRGFTWWASTEDGYVLDHEAEGFSTYHHWLVEKGHVPADTGVGGARVFSRTSAARLPEHAGKPAFLAEQACEFLDQHRDVPFFLSVNFLEPHPPYRSPRDGMYAPQDVSLPSTWYAEPDEESLPVRLRARRAYYAAHPPPPENSERSWKEIKARYWGSVSLVDDYVGVVLGRLATLGLADETIVVFTSDHGDMMGDHRLLAKHVPYEGSARVPLLVRVPGVAPTRIAEPVSQVDLVPTLMDALQVPPPAGVHGASLLPAMRGSARPDADVVIEWSGEREGEGEGREPGSADREWGIVPKSREALALVAQQRTIRRGRWKLTVDETGDHELYDLDEDPGETRNLMRRRPGAGREPSPVARAAVHALWDGVCAWQHRTGDTLQLPSPT